MIRQQNFFESNTFKIIALNMIVFIGFLIARIFFDTQVLLSLFALQPSSIIQGQRLWTLVTSMFLHFEIWHLFANMISLYFVGTFVEQLIRKKRYIIFYLFAGIFAGVFWVLVSTTLSLTPTLTRVFGNPLVFGIGASGAVFGLLGILAILTPRARVSFIAGPLIAFILLGVLSSSSVVSPEVLGALDIIFFIYILFTFSVMLSFDSRLIRFAFPIDTTMKGLAVIAIVPLIILSFFIDLPIGNMAHLGGLLAGMLYATQLRRQFPRRSKMIEHTFR